MEINLKKLNNLELDGNLFRKKPHSTSSTMQCQAQSQIAHLTNANDYQKKFMFEVQKF